MQLDEPKLGGCNTCHPPTVLIHRDSVQVLGACLTVEENAETELDVLPGTAEISTSSVPPAV